MARTAIASTAGGFVSKAAGGDFSAGAMSAAFVHLFNNEMEKPRKLLSTEQTSSVLNVFYGEKSNEVDINEKAKALATDMYRLRGW